MQSNGCITLEMQAGSPLQERHVTLAHEACHGISSAFYPVFRLQAEQLGLAAEYELYEQVYSDMVQLASRKQLYSTLENATDTIDFRIVFRHLTDEFRAFYWENVVAAQIQYKHCIMQDLLRTAILILDTFVQDHGGLDPNTGRLLRP